MDRITISVPDHMVDRLDELAEEDHDGNRSAAVVELMKKGDQYDDLVKERDLLREKLAAVNTQMADTAELVEYVEEERSWRSAPIWKRARWWVTGKQ